MKIQLQSLRAINCGPLRDVCIHFNTDGDSPVTVLAGANGRGKTTALELIKALAELLDPDFPLAPPADVLTRTEYAQMNWLMDGEKFSMSVITRDRFRNLLARSVKERVGLHEDIKTIIEQRVLA